MMELMDAPEGNPESERLDPRIRRTRELLQAALQRLLETKSFEKISVGEIADEAALNRATFYDHYPDKLALLEGLVSTRFQALLAQRHVVFDGGCGGAIMAITLAMCDYLTALPARDCAEHRRLEHHFESALMSVVRCMILSGLRRSAQPSSAPPELVAATVSGAIYGGVSEWLRTPDRVPAEEVVRSIFSLVRPMLHPAESGQGFAARTPVA
jgi:AcrR family transcriptional regulator